ncbi:MAG TPA: DUF4253 domain-containing protein [Bacteroidia bacterium]|nr:DUF4253 domain-containing protein [Bacteroidia bacterium]
MQTNNPLQLTPGEDEIGEVAEEDRGLCSKINSWKDLAFIPANKELFRSKGYLLFLFKEPVHTNGEDFIAMIKGTDEIEIAKWRKTEGINHSIDNDALLSKLNDWKKIAEFTIIGAGAAGLDLLWKRKPHDMRAFTADVNEFCPDMNGHSDDVEALQNDLENMSELTLWWS